MSKQKFIIGLPEDPEIHHLARDLGYTSVILRPHEKPLPDCHSPLQQYVGVPFNFPRNLDEALKAIQKAKGTENLILGVDPVTAISVITKFVVKNAKGARPIAKPILLDISRFLLEEYQHKRDPLINRSHALYLMKQTVKILESIKVPLLLTTDVTKDKSWRLRSPDLLITLAGILGISRYTATAAIESVPLKIIEYWKKITPEK